MIIPKKQITIFLLILHLTGLVVFSQDRKTKNNYTGAWTTPASWNPSWPVPQTNVNNLDITINGYITANNSLAFSGSSKLIVDDTLVVIGNLTINDNNDVQVNNNGILIVRGNLTLSEHTHITADGYVIITGNIIKIGPTNDGSFKSNDDPVNVFVGGTIYPANLTDNKSDYPALDCTSPNTTPYPHSDCSHGDMTDIITDPIYPFFQSTCTTATLISSDANNSFCAGTSITFTAGGGTNYNFRVDGTSVQNGGSTTYTTTTLTNGTIVDVLVTGIGCTAPSAGITNTVFALPIPTITGPNAVCVGTVGNVYSTEAGMSNYLWTVSAGGTITAGGATGNNTVTVTWTTTGAKTVAVNYTNGNGCKAISPAINNVTVNSLPIATASNNGPVCTGNVLSLTAGPPVMTTYSWTGPNGFTAITQSPTVSPAATVEMSGIYSLTITDTSGCTSVAVTTTAVVNSLPIVTATSNSPVCVESPLTLTGGPTGMTIYSWTGPNGFTSLLQNPSVTLKATLAMAGVYTLMVTNANGCTNTSTTTVLVNPLPVATASNSGPLCEGNVLNLTASPAGITAYSWIGPLGFTSILQNPKVSDNTTLDMAGIYKLTYTDASGCFDTASTKVIVNALPLVTITSSSSSMCENDSRTLTGSPAGGTFSLSEGPATITGNVLLINGIGTIRIEYNYTDACTNKDTQSIIVNENPNAIAGPDQNLEFIFEAQMKAELSPSETGEWSLVAGSGSIYDIHSPTSLVTDLSSGENIFLWKVQKSNCEASAEVKITVHDLFIPSVITPNGDGKNDFFKIVEDIGRMELIIFNRWGNEEYANDDYLNEWDGRNNKGSELPNDTYFYILKFEDGNIKKGSVLIKR